MLNPKFLSLRNEMIECHVFGCWIDQSYRVLSDEDILQVGDQTVCGSTLLSGREDWQTIGKDFEEVFGCTVKDMNDPYRTNDIDCEERLFRRKI